MIGLLILAREMVRGSARNATPARTFGALAKTNFERVATWEKKERDDEGVIGNRRGRVCSPESAVRNPQWAVGDTKSI